MIYLKTKTRNKNMYFKFRYNTKTDLIKMNALLNFNKNICLQSVSLVLFCYENHLCLSKDVCFLCFLIEFIVSRFQRHLLISFIIYIHKKHRQVLKHFFDSIGFRELFLIWFDIALFSSLACAFVNPAKLRIN